MKLSFATALVVSLAAESAVAQFGWFSKTAYNKWHQTELERWLSDNDIPYPTPADRKNLENLVKTNWHAAVESPYANWDANRLQKYLSSQGKEVKKGTEKNKDALVSQVKSTWHDAEGQASTAYGDVKSWIFDTWTESSLKAFCDKYNIPVPQPRKRDSLIAAARSNYASAASKLNEQASYPGNWLYAAWSDSELKAWLDERGIPAPQTGSRDKLIASVRRNSYLASRNAYGLAADASASAAAAQQTLGEAIFDSWSDSQIKAWADKNGIKVPQGSNRNELLAVARKNIAKLTGDNIPDAAASQFGAATSSAGNEYAKATASAYSAGNNVFDQASSVIMSVVNEVQIMVGLKTNYLSSASKSAASLGAKATKSAKSAKNEL